MKTNNEKQHWNTAMTNSNEKQQSYYNEKTMRHKNVNTIVQQSYYNLFNNEKPIKHTNETRQWNTTIKTNIETQQWHTAMTNNKLQQWNNNETQEWRNNNLTTIVQQWKANESH